MFTLAHLETPPPEALKGQLLQMVVDYLGDISAVSLTPSNLLYPLYQYVVGLEVHRYLDSMDGAQPGKPELIMALDAEDPATLLGFALYLPYVDDRGLRPGLPGRERGAAPAGHRPGDGRTDAVALPSRGGGVRGGQGRLLRGAGLHAAGSARPAGADEHAEPGFRRCGGGAGSAAHLPAQEVRQIYSYLVKQHGQSAMKAAEKRRDLLLDELARQADQLIGLRTSAKRLH